MNSRVQEFALTESMNTQKVTTAQACNGRMSGVYMSNARKIPWRRTSSSSNTEIPTTRRMVRLRVVSAFTYAHTRAATPTARTASVTRWASVNCPKARLAGAAFGAVKKLSNQ